MIQIHIGFLIKQARKYKGLSQAQLSKKLKWHAQFISNIERGKAPLPANKIKAISKILEIHRDVIIDEMMRDYRFHLEKKVYGR